MPLWRFLCSFFTPKVTGTGVFDYRRKLSYNFSGGISYKANDDFSVDSYLEYVIVNYKYNYSFTVYNAYTGLIIHDTTTFIVRDSRVNIGTFFTYNFIKKQKFIVHSQIGNSLQLFDFLKINKDAINNTPLYGGKIYENYNFLLLLGVGVKYCMNKKNFTVVRLNFMSSLTGLKCSVLFFSINIPSHTG